MDRPRILISACLLGIKVRYDRGDRFDPLITGTLGRIFDFIPICPETEAGLPVPREPMRLIGDPSNPRMETIETKIDHTDLILDWAMDRIAALEHARLSGFIFKTRSPSCGPSGVGVYTDDGSCISGSGIFAALIAGRFPDLPMTDEECFKNPALRLDFIEMLKRPV